MIVRLVLGLFAVLGTQAALAQQPECRFFKVQSGTLNVSKEPRGDATYIDMLGNADIVCVTREQKVGDRDWAFVAHKVVKPDQRAPVDGWVNQRSLQRLSDAETAALRGGGPPPTAAAPPVPSPPAPAEENIVRFTEPLTFGPFPVNGSSLEQLSNGIPLFPPMEGLDEVIWKRNCSACHKWDRRTLCEQGASYAKNPRSALRHPHPYGGADKIALMQWAKTGCQ
jgi:hypothetical protein